MLILINKHENIAALSGKADRPRAALCVVFALVIADQSVVGDERTPGGQCDIARRHQPVETRCGNVDLSRIDRRVDRSGNFVGPQKLRRMHGYWPS